MASHAQFHFSTATMSSKYTFSIELSLATWWIECFWAHGQLQETSGWMCLGAEEMKRAQGAIYLQVYWGIFPWQCDGTVMTALMALTLRPLELSKRNKEQEGKQNEARRQQQRWRRWLDFVNTHLQSWAALAQTCQKLQLLSHKPLFSFFFFFSFSPPSSITARPPRLIHFKQWCLLWWIHNARELENYYLDLTILFFLGQSYHTNASRSQLSISANLSPSLHDEQNRFLVSSDSWI